MFQQVTQGAESAIALAPANSLAESSDASLEFAFHASLPELLALPKDRLLVLNVDVRGAVCLGLAAPERLRAWRSRIIDELPRFDINALDRLEQYAKALMRAQVEYTLARKSPADVRALAEATQRRYQVLMNDARALAGRGMLAPEQLLKFTGCRRRADKVLALSALVSVLKTAWPRIKGKTALTLAELEQADELVMQLMSALAHQKNPLRDLAKIAELRQRAFTLFANAYCQVRRAIQYLCANEREAECIIPSLYPRKRAARKPDTAAAAVEPVAQTATQSTAASAQNQWQTAGPSIQSREILATTACTAMSDPATASASTYNEIANAPLSASVPHRQSKGNAPPKTAVTPRKPKQRRRATKRERFLRALGVATRGHGTI